MSDINIFPKTERDGTRRFLIIAESEKGLKNLKENFMTVSELVSITCDDAELQTIVRKFQEEELTVEVY